ncbi:MAG TPA: histidine triad nucleotide-binding protein [bacterium]
MTRADCLFCRIANRDLEANVVGETESLLAFRDMNPQAPTHILIIPKEHIPTLTDLTESHTALMGGALHFINRLAGQYQLSKGGYRVVINCGPQAGQSVFHLHFHLLGGRQLSWPPG